MSDVWEHDPRAPYNELEEVETCPVCGEPNRHAPDHLYPCCSEECAARHDPCDPPDDEGVSSW